MVLPPPAPATSGVDDVDTAADGAQPAWRERAIERSTQSARQRAAKRVQRFLNAAREIIAEKGSIEFTVQEVVDRSKQSLRSFYQYFDGKHELLLGLFEEEMELAARRFREATANGDPLERLRAAITMMVEAGRPGSDDVQPLFFEFAQRLMIDHPDEVAQAYAPVFDYLVAIVEAAADEGLLRPGRPRRLAAIVLQTATSIAARSGAGASSTQVHRIKPEEVGEFCLHAIVPDEVLAGRQRKASRTRR